MPLIIIIITVAVDDQSEICCSSPQILLVLVYGYRWTQEASGTAGLGNVWLHHASSYWIYLMLNTVFVHYFQHIDMSTLGLSSLDLGFGCKKLEVSGKLLQNASAQACTHIETDGQVKHIMPSVTHGMDGRCIKTKADRLLTSVCIYKFYLLAYLLTYLLFCLSVDGLREQLMTVFSSLMVPDLALPECGGLQAHRTDGSRVQLGRIFPSSVMQHISDYTVLFVGNPECLFLAAVLMMFGVRRCVTCNPQTNAVVEIDSKDSSKTLARRYYLVECARDAQRVGILIGTLGVANHLDIARQLESTMRCAGKAVYRFVVGKPDTAKLANFSDIDIFVLIACPENSLIDSKEFFRPIVTPFEMELACNPQRQWTGTCELDYRQLLPGNTCSLVPACQHSDKQFSKYSISTQCGKAAYCEM